MSVDLTGGRGWLNPAPAASIARIDRALGRPLQISEAGRSFFQQEKFYKAWLNGTGNYALSPYAPSVHQIGDAIDTDDWVHHTALLNEHGWFQTVFWPDGTLREGWHFEYDPSRDQHINDAAPTGTKEDDMIEDLYTKFGKKGGQPVKAGEAPNLHINDQKDVSVVRGAAKQIVGNLSVQVSGGKAYVGVLQVIPYVVTYENGNESDRVSLMAQEIVFTGGDTFGKIPVNCALKANQRLSFRIGGSSHDFTVKSAVFRGMKVT